MIADRIRNNDGIHLMLERDGEIVSHGNSTAGAGRTVMLGGVGTAPAFRGRGYASEIVSALSRAVLARGKEALRLLRARAGGEPLRPSRLPDGGGLGDFGGGGKDGNR